VDLGVEVDSRHYLGASSFGNKRDMTMLDLNTVCMAYQGCVAVVWKTVIR